jgi:endonuclease/exonuclease/phosphatase family metal-dependent hydrolase
MMIRLHTRWRWLKRFFTRSEWMVRLLGLPKFAVGDHRSGLILIQIDGLSFRELTKAFNRGEMPFLSKRMKQDEYALRPMYSGLPSNTPAVQAELFYGVRGAVPAFCFRDHQCGRVRKMFESDTVQQIESELAKQGEPLLRGGSSYCNIYTGGAREPRFCAASMGWGTSTKSPGVVILLLLAIANANMFIRAAAFGLLELLLACIDVVKGVARGQALIQELKFLPARIGICVLLREWIAGAAKMDAIRGMPVIHANFIGYDEQAHRRGPDSLFAHWVLKGIDDSIKRIWKTAENSARREYEIWVYSDHGQVHTRPYEKVYGKTLECAVREYWQGVEPARVEPRKPPSYANREGSERIRFLGGLRLQKLFSLPPPPTDSGTEVVVTDLGPVALVYLGKGATEERRLDLAKQLVEKGGVPIVMDTHPGNGLTGWTREGRFSLPEDADRILGAHPFKDEITPDLERLCRHENAGDLVLLGWKAGMKHPLTFANENGSHGGINPGECSAFFAVPKQHIGTHLNGKAPRPEDLRMAALDFLGGKPGIRIPWAGKTEVKSGFRIMTYNVHSCIGLDREHRPDRIAKVVSHFRPDIIAMQELDQGQSRSFGAHQAQVIAEILKFDQYFHSVREKDDGKFGQAILSRHPMRVLRAGGLPTLRGRPQVESRGALWVEIEIEGRRLQVLNTHLGLWSRERDLQVKALLGENWIGGRDDRVPFIFCGDLNATPSSPIYQRLSEILSDSAIAGKDSPIGKRRVQRTFPSFYPCARLDHIFVDAGLRVQNSFVPNQRWIRMASDHLPVVADIVF